VPPRVVPILLLALLAVPAAAEAKYRGACIPGTSGGPKCHVWNAKYDFVSDGDTIHVKVGGKRRLVRFTSVQAMEHTRYSRNPAKRRGECHALEATARVDRLIKRAGKRVRLAARHPGSRTSDGRLLRAVAVKAGGRWIDLGSTLIEEGHALWLWNGRENAWNRAYSEAAERASERGANLWDPAYCGAGPDAQLKLWINWDADSDDRRNINGEWAKIKNLGASDVSLAGWWYRDAAHGRYRFPSGARIPAGGTITVFMGNGSSAGDVFHWGLDLPTFPTLSRDDPDAAGDGGYLFDPQGDLRAWMIYPCYAACDSPLSGNLRLRAQPRSPESITVTNTGNATAELEGHRIVTEFKGYAFPPDTALDPGESLVVRVTGDPSRNSRLQKFWGLGNEILDARGDWVRVDSLEGERIACESWGSGSC
jgi:endonuclease YncB( thermonuclease family)